MPIQLILEGWTIDDVVDNQEWLRSVYRSEHKLIAFKKFYPTEEDLKTFRDVFQLGDDDQFTPDYVMDYKELFERIEKQEYKNITADPDMLMNPWHVENNYMLYPPVDAVWVMETFTCDKGKGNTGFVDSAAMYRAMPEEWQDLVSKVVQIAYPGWFKIDRDLFMRLARETIPSGKPMWYPVPGTDEAMRINPHPFAMPHPVTGEMCLRTVTEHPPGDLPGVARLAIPGWLGTVKAAEDSSSGVVAIDPEGYTDPMWLGDFRHFAYEYLSDNPYWYEWDEGDMLVFDIFSLTHCAQHGFKYGERLLRGQFYWYGQMKAGQDPMDRKPIWEISDTYEGKRMTPAERTEAAQRLTI